MIGIRLIEADHIAKKRSDRCGYNAGRVTPGIFRKWNGTCSCWACRPLKYKCKGKNKWKNHRNRLYEIAT